MGGFSSPQEYADHCWNAFPVGYGMVMSDAATHLITLILPIPMARLLPKGENLANPTAGLEPSDANDKKGRIGGPSHDWSTVRNSYLIRQSRVLARQ